MWFQHQPFTQVESLLGDLHRRHTSVTETVKNFVRFGLSIPLFLLPVISGFASPKWVRDRRSRITAIVGATSVVLLTGMAYAIHQRRSLEGWFAPYIGNYFTAGGVLDIPAIGVRPTVLGLPVRAAITWMVVAGLVAFIACIVGRIELFSGRTGDGLRQNRKGTELLVKLAPLTLVYCTLLIPRGVAGNLFDRYLLPLLVVALIFFLLLYQRFVATRLPVLSVAVLVIVTAYSITSTHDFYSIERARLEAANELRVAGVMPTSFYAGFEYDGSTQIQSWGYFDSPYLNLPAKLKRAPSWDLGFQPCGYFFYRMLPAIRPEYALSYDQTACQGPSRFAPVEYRTWLPPYKGEIYIRKVSAGPTGQ